MVDTLAVPPSRFKTLGQLHNLPGRQIYFLKKPQSAFLPSSLSGNQLWLDASDLTTITESGGDVSQWDDKSGKGNHAVQGTASNQPGTGTNTLNGKNVLDFDGTEFMDIPYAVGLNPTTFSVFAVCRSTTLKVNEGVMTTIRSGAVNGGFSIILGTLREVNSLLSEGSTGTFDYMASTPDIVQSQWYLHNVNHGGAADASLYVDAVLKDTSTKNVDYDFNEDVGIAKFYNNSITSIELVGDIAEIILYDRALTTTERQQVESYLNTKWGGFPQISSSWILQDGTSKWVLQDGTSNWILQ